MTGRYPRWTARWPPEAAASRPLNHCVPGNYEVSLAMLQLQPQLPHHFAPGQGASWYLFAIGLEPIFSFG
jgi:hypothetical protein